MLSKSILQILFPLSLILLVNPEQIKHREKRFLLYYPNGGVFKLVLGFAMPVPLGLKQSMAWGWNFQWQYPLPQFPNMTRVFPPIVSRMRQKRSSDRALAYSGFEDFLDKNGLNGRECLLRTICENAMHGLYHEANGLYGHLLHIALTPDYSDATLPQDLDPIYLEAKKAGQYGVDCSSIYTDCKGFLNLFSLFDE